MRILIAPDKFKGTLTASQAAEAIARGAVRALGEGAQIMEIAMADGGEGSVEIVVSRAGYLREVPARDAKGRDIVSQYGIVSDAAFIETAASVGLNMIDRHERDALTASSYGLGMVVRAAIENKERDITVFLGGSATNDCGAGMLAAMGCRFYDEEENEITIPAGEDLIRIARIETKELSSLISGCRFTAACDVTNPLTGDSGAARVYSPQKGADPQAVETLEKGAVHFSALASSYTGTDHAKTPGAGAAGGLGWALLTFCGAQVVSGAELIGDITGFPEAADDADLIITGEGRIDSQTKEGKVINYISRKAARRHIPVIAYCGDRARDMTADDVRNTGLFRLFTMSSYAGLEKSRTEAALVLENLVATTLLTAICDMMK